MVCCLWSHQYFIKSKWSQFRSATLFFPKNNSEKALAEAVCGVNNATARAIAKKYAAILEEVNEKNEGESKKDFSFSQQQREWCVNSLSFVAPGLSRQQMNNIGFPIGQNLFESVKAFCDSGIPIYSTPPSHHPGKKRFRASPEVGEYWVEKSQILSRTNAQGENFRAALGGRAVVASEIVKHFNCSKATAYRYCPQTVITGRKHTDLCIFCEALRKIKIECVRAANLKGGNFCMPGDNPGQGAIRQPGNEAAAFLVQFVYQDEDVARLLGELKELEWHEELAATLTGEMTLLHGNQPVVVFDFSASLELQGARGDAKDFVRPPSISLFGVMFVVPDPTGEKNFIRKYVNIFSFSHAHTSNVAIASLQNAMDIAYEEKILPDDTEKISFFSDKGKHFCSGETAYGVLFDITKYISEVSYTFSACYHGKTPLDGHFNHTKQTIGKMVSNWPNSKALVKLMVLNMTKKHMKNTYSVFLDDTRVKRLYRSRLKIANISNMQRFSRSTKGNPPQDRFQIEGVDSAIKIEPMKPGEAEENPLGDLMQKAKFSVKQLCAKIKKQRETMELIKPPG